MARRRKRTLNSEELDLWGRVTSTAVPLSADRPKTLVVDNNAPPVVQRATVPNDFTIGKRAKSTATTVPRSAAPKSLAMDKKAFMRMKRGKLSPEARIDLHGMTLAQAHPVLTRFILDAHDAGRRLVLVITGKGKARLDDGPIPERIGVLRHQVPLWLRQAPLGALVLEISAANQRHGGGGAFYVYLRRTR